MDLDLLVSDRMIAFATFARTLNFTHTAEELHISQPALHKKIRGLETSLGVELCISNPKTKGVVGLTPAGEELARFANENIRDARDTLIRLGVASSRRLVVAAGRGAYLYVVPEKMKLLSDRPGGLQAIVAKNDEAIDLARSGIADVIVVAFMPPPKDLQSTPLATYEQNLVLHQNHRLADCSSVEVKDLDGMEFALPESGVRMRDYLAEKFLNNGIDLEVRSEALEWDMLVQLVKFGIEATIVNSFMPIGSDLVKIPIKDLAPATYWAAWREERSEMAGEFLAADETDKPPHRGVD